MKWGIINSYCLPSGPRLMLLYKIWSWSINGRMPCITLTFMFRSCTCIITYIFNSLTFWLCSQFHNCLFYTTSACNVCAFNFHFLVYNRSLRSHSSSSLLSKICLSVRCVFYCHDFVIEDLLFLPNKLTLYGLTILLKNGRLQKSG